MKVTLTEIVDVSDEELRLLKLLQENGLTCFEQDGLKEVASIGDELVDLTQFDSLQVKDLVLRKSDINFGDPYLIVSGKGYRLFEQINQQVASEVE